MRPLLVYDWPTRIFHWLFAGSFVAAFAISACTTYMEALPLLNPDQD